MMGLFPRTTGALAIFVVVILVHGELRIETKGQYDEEEMTMQQAKRRQKREWVKFAKPCREGEDNSKRNPIAKITSDYQATQKITYRISGVGIDQPPFGIFVVDKNTGDINITAIVDREETPSFLITCRALNAQGLDVEKPLILTVKILDINDNPPVFSQQIFMGEIEENSASNSLVMILNATDADEPNHLNSKIAFKIVSQEPAGTPMFLLSRNTGEVRTLTNSLDREQASSYRLVVSGADKDGEGLSTQCECNIKVKDVNDNFPMFRDSQYSARIEENILSSELLRFQVTDLDEEYTDNWLAVYFFTSGNEGNWFEIQTDPRTNEGILKVVKALDYEQLQSVKLSIAVKNKAEFHQSVISRYRVQSTPVTIQVINVREGIAFRPASKTFTVQKGISSKKLVDYILGTYQAIDEDTNKAASNVKYVMGRNDGGYLMIDSKTAEIKFVKNMNRDSTFIVNKTITAEVLAIDEYTGKTSTGTVYVRVPDFNDNCPTAVLEKDAVCSSSPSVVVSARTLNNRYTGPYTFALEDQPVKLPAVWSITTLNATSALLRAQEQIPPGVYHISLVLTDSQNNRCEMPRSLTLEVCQCDNRGICGTSYPTTSPGTRYGRPHSGRLGPAAIGLLLLGLLLLLLAPLLLLTCDCGAGSTGGVTGGFIPVPDGSEGTIHQWGIEGAHPEDKEITNICVPPVTANGADFMESSVCTNTYARGTAVEGTSGMEMTTKLGAATESGGAAGFATGTVSGAASGFGAATGVGICSSGQSGTMRTRHSTGGTNKDYADGAISMNFLDSYFSQKAFACAEEDDGQEANDCLLIYDNEGADATGSPVGSVGCCSFIADDLDDSFLDSLGPKFKKLAEISLGVDGEGKEVQPPSKDSGYGIESCGHPIEVQQTGFVKCQTLSGSQGASALSTSGSVQPAVSIPDPLQHGNYLVTETYSASGSLVQPSTAGFDPLLTQNVIVTERVICPISSVPGNLAGPTQLRGSHTMLCTEDPCSRLI
ncbi:desmoglein-3 isoform X1 [Homo sapiens]|uniref:desmoglein-3 isoform X1 n=1 Tax=Homo sapiens TaxID=9606 RepID=UPI0005D03638|nr:desmoglein-3 isoform X1 [Homo sapiens]|eukprot:XP_011524152.1 desmoglein-3 isoform X1 [Homo sapiens]